MNPQIEPIAGDDRHGMVTFRWSGAAERVSLRSALAVADGRLTTPLRRTPGTDDWTLSIPVRNDISMTYQFVVDDPFDGMTLDEVMALFQQDPASASEKMGRHNAGARADPSNPDSIPPQMALSSALDPVAQPKECWDSVLTMPSAEPLEWHEVPAERAARVDHKFSSALFGNDRTVTVCVPPGLSKEDGPYPAVVALDAELMLGWRLDDVLTNLVAAGRIPPMIGVFVHNASVASRMTEMTTNPALPGMLADELLPWVREHYPVSSDPAKVLIAGNSATGHAAAWAAYERSDTFGNVLSMSGSFIEGAFRGHAGPLPKDSEEEPEWLARQFAAADRKDIRFWLDAGVLENLAVGLPGVTMLSANRHLRTVLTAKGYEVTLYESPGGHDIANWRRTFPKGLIQLGPGMA